MPGRFNLETTTLAQLLDDPEARAVLDELAPQVAKHPMIAFVKAMPAAQLLAMAGDQIPADLRDQVKARIEAL